MDGAKNMTTLEIAKGLSPSFGQPPHEGISSLVRRAGRAAVGAVDQVLDLLDGQREQALLRAMSDRELKDIGLSRAAIGGDDARDGRGW